MMAKPIKPDEVVKHKKNAFPDFVIETWNKLIASEWSNGKAFIYQKDAIDALMVAAPSCAIRSDVFKFGWLDIEDIYKDEGWNVYYDKPAWCETYEPSFKFTRGKKHVQSNSSL